MEFGIRDRTALVTGASQGIGEAIARSLHREGARVAILARSEGKIRAIANDLGEGAIAVAGDVADPSSVEAAVAAVERALGPIDILVNSAGGVQSSTGTLFRPFEKVPEADWRATWELNVLSVVRIIRLVAPRMADRGWGRIVNISSESGVQPDPVAIEYASAKGALNLLTKGLSKAYAARGVLVNCVSPAYVDTPVLRDVLAQQDGAEGVAPEDLAKHFLSSFRPNIGLGRACSPEDVATAVTFLASEAAGFVTGTNLRVDGGSVTTF